MLLDRATEIEMERKDKARVICIFKRLDSIGYDNEAIPFLLMTIYFSSHPSVLEHY